MAGFLITCNHCDTEIEVCNVSKTQNHNIIMRINKNDCSLILICKNCDNLIDQKIEEIKVK